MRLWLVAIMVNHKSHRRRVIFGYRFQETQPSVKGCHEKTRGQELFLQKQYCTLLLVGGFMVYLVYFFLQHMTGFMVYYWQKNYLWTTFYPLHTKISENHIIENYWLMELMELMRLNFHLLTKIFVNHIHFVLFSGVFQKTHGSLLTVVVVPWVPGNPMKAVVSDVSGMVPS